MNARVLMVMVGAFVLGAAWGCSGDMSREVCGDGLDNDGNGLTDCDDRECNGQPACIPPDYGPCGTCGQSCTAQNTCVLNVLNDRPLPMCLSGKCTALEKFIQPRIELDTRANWAGVSVQPRSAATRFIKKTAVDGSPVNCARVQSIASSRNAPNAIEDAGVQLQGIDVTRVTNPQLGQGISLAFVNTQTGGDYLIWEELWAGFPDSTTGMPTGLRLGWGCFEDAATTTALVASDNCPSATNDAGTCRTFRLVMPGPE